MTDINLTIISGDDWEGVYKDGKLYVEGHSVQLIDVLDMLKDCGPITSINYKTEYPNMDWLNDMGSLPVNLKDVILYDDAYAYVSEYVDEGDYEDDKDDEIPY